MAAVDVAEPIATNGSMFYIPDDNTNDSIDSKSNDVPEADRKTKPKRNPRAIDAAYIGIELDEGLVTVDRIYEYKWPQDKSGEMYMLQEQLSRWLEVLSFKRKYPEMTRRAISLEERLHLEKKRIVTKMQADLGLTPLLKDEVLDILSKDYPDKYDEYMNELRERRKQELRERAQNSAMPKPQDREKMALFVKKAAKAAASFNARLMRDRRGKRTAYFDMQTFEVHFPKNRYPALPPEATAPGPYPVSLIPGQFQDYYKKYTQDNLQTLPLTTALVDPPVLSSAELHYLPVNTALYDPPRYMKNIYADPKDSDGEASAADQDSDDSDSDSSDSSSDDSDSQSAETPDVKSAARTPAPRNPVSRNSTPIPRKKAQAAVEAVTKATDLTDGLAESPLVSKTPRELKVNESNLYRICCVLCRGDEARNLKGQPEELLKCAACDKRGHPTCFGLTEVMAKMAKTYQWQCMECKVCMKCKQATQEKRLMFCDVCDKGYHTFCVGLRRLPRGAWKCPECKPPEEERPSTPAGDQPKKRGRPFGSKNRPKLKAEDADDTLSEKATPTPQRRRRPKPARKAPLTDRDVIDGLRDLDSDSVAEDGDKDEESAPPADNKPPKLDLSLTLDMVEAAGEDVVDEEVKDTADEEVNDAADEEVKDAADEEVKDAADDDKDTEGEVKETDMSSSEPAKEEEKQPRRGRRSRKPRSEEDFINTDAALYDDRRRRKRLGSKKSEADEEEHITSPERKKKKLQKPAVSPLEGGREKITMKISTSPNRNSEVICLSSKPSTPARPPVISLVSDSSAASTPARSGAPSTVDLTSPARPLAEVEEDASPPRVPEFAGSRDEEVLSSQRSEEFTPSDVSTQQSGQPEGQ